MKLKKIIILISCLMMFSCSTMKESLIIGSSSGIVTGVVSGSLIAGRKNKGKGVVIGALTGGALGLAAGYVFRKLVNNKKKVNQKTFKELPPLHHPVIKKQWVKDRVEGSKYIKGHWQYFIDKNSSWGIPK